MKKLDLIDIKSDYVFKRVFTLSDDIFIDFANSVLNYSNERKIKSVQFLNNEIMKDSEIDKESRFDIIAKLNDNSYINIEMQVQNTGEYEKRSLYYWSKLYELQLKKTQNYMQLFPAICINVLDFNFFKSSNDFYTQLGIVNLKTQEHIFNDFQIIYLEIPKFTKKYYNDLEKWMQFLKGASKKEIIAMENKNIIKAYEILEFVSHDPIERAKYEARRKFQLDHNTSLLTAEKRGIEKGVEKEKITIAIKMLNQGFPIDQISELTQLSCEEIKNLK
ncbi:Rpn family recombination-promoting nuclease/putative transposase [Fluviispira multicolorata]|uniref:Rpn family recombination-promoting nuclease/putative transposase n=1 Tax=Fluviispira multicolorata TaxID=2654512 RepID=UPI0013756698|nr:Rpn family recombination-promoting nuclease/putative transposase [Fluviispira multicolorata]